MAGFQQRRAQSISQLDGLNSRLEKARELLLTEGIGVEDYQIIKNECEQKITALKEQISNLPDIEETVTKLLNRNKTQLLKPLPLWPAISKRSAL